MKMMSSTRSTSMSGVTLMFALWPPPVPTAILMVGSPLTSLASLPTRRSGRRSVWRALPLVGKQTQIIHPCGAHSVHYLDNIAEVGAGIRFEVDLFVRMTGQAILHLAGQTVHLDLIGAEVDRAIAHHRNQQRVFFICVLHRRRVVHLRHV